MWQPTGCQTSLEVQSDWRVGASANNPASATGREQDEWGRRCGRKTSDMRGDARLPGPVYPSYGKDGGASFPSRATQTAAVNHFAPP